MKTLAKRLSQLEQKAESGFKNVLCIYEVTPEEYQWLADEYNAPLLDIEMGPDKPARLIDGEWWLLDEDGEPVRKPSEVYTVTKESWERIMRYF